MDADKDVKFEFFKYKKKPTMKYQLALWLLWSPFFIVFLISSFNHQKVVSQSELVTVAAPHDSGYVSLIKAMDEQEALIDTVQVLNLNNVENTVKEIQKIGLSARSIGFKDGGRLYAVGYKSLTGAIRYALLSNNKNNNEIKISWKDVGTSSIFLAVQWDHDTYPIQSVNNGNQKDIELKITYNNMKEYQRIRVLEENLMKLQKENDKIKKEYSENVIKKTIKENPSLKSQEEELKKYINLIINSKK